MIPKMAQTLPIKRSHEQITKPPTHPPTSKPTIHHPSSHPSSLQQPVQSENQTNNQTNNQANIQSIKHETNESAKPQYTNPIASLIKRVAPPPPTFDPSTNGPPITPSFDMQAANEQLHHPNWLKVRSQHQLFRSAKNIINFENYHKYPPGQSNYQSIRSEPSMYPSPKYCDITHLIARYTDPVTRLHYHDAAAYEVIRSLSREEIKARLEARNETLMEIA